MKPFSIAGLAVAAAISFAGCGIGTADYDGQDPTLGNYEEPLTTSAGVATCTSPKKVLICHIPPGNPANAHSICVGLPAQPAHLAHGDYLGGCGGGNTTNDGGTVTGSGGGSGSGAGGGGGSFNDGSGGGGTGGGAGGGVGGAGGGSGAGQTGGGTGGGTGGAGGGTGGTGTGGGTGGTGGGSGGSGSDAGSQVL